MRKDQKLLLPQVPDWKAELNQMSEYSLLINFLQLICCTGRKAELQHGDTAEWVCCLQERILQIRTVGIFVTCFTENLEHPVKNLFFISFLIVSRVQTAISVSFMRRGAFIISHLLIEVVRGIWSRRVGRGWGLLWQLHFNKLTSRDTRWEVLNAQAELSPANAGGRCLVYKIVTWK